jgi:hypothetical protein
LRQVVVLYVLGKVYGTAKDDFFKVATENLFGAPSCDVQIEGQQRFQRVEELANHGACILLVAQAGLEGEKEATGRHDVGPHVGVLYEVDAIGDHFDLADPHLLQLHGATDVVRKVAVQGIPSHVDILLVGDIKCGTYNTRIVAVWIER